MANYRRVSRGIQIFSFMPDAHSYQAFTYIYIYQQYILKEKTSQTRSSFFDRKEYWQENER